MDGIISYEKDKELEKLCKTIAKFDGIINQITHLRVPDDNEVFKWVFEYLEESIMSKDRALKILLKEILKIKQKNKDIIKANLDKHNYIPEEFRK